MKNKGTPGPKNPSSNSLTPRFLREFSINWEGDTGLSDSYLSRVEAVRSLGHFVFERNITFFAGENGSGKSTLLEAIAIAWGLNPEGGTSNYQFSTYDDYSELSRAVRIVRGPYRPHFTYFLRAESFYNMATATNREYNYDGRMPDYHARSHGESFLDFILRYDRPGLYLMDEPEAALSPQTQLTLLIHLARMADQGSQFIIASHSPILMGVPGADILSFDDGCVRRVAYEETDAYQVMKLFLDNREAFVARLLREE